MPLKVKIQESPRTERAAYQQGEHALPQADGRLDKILQQAHPFELESHEAFDPEYDCSSDHYGRMIKSNEEKIDRKIYLSRIVYVFCLAFFLVEGALELFALIE